MTPCFDGGDEGSRNVVAAGVHLRPGRHDCNRCIRNMIVIIAAGGVWQPEEIDDRTKVP